MEKAVERHVSGRREEYENVGWLLSAEWGSVAVDDGGANQNQRTEVGT